MSADYAAMTKYLKTNYINNGHLYSMFAGKSPCLQKILSNSKSGRKTGTSITTPVAVARSQSSGASFSSVGTAALGNSTQEGLKRQSFVVPFSNDIYERGFIDNKARFASKDSAGSFVEAVEDETKMKMDALNSRISKDLWGNGSGALGKVASISSGVVTLSSYTDLFYLEVGTFIDIYHGSTRRGTASVYITKRDEAAKKITLSATPTGTAANDLIYAAGDTPSAAATFHGVDSWVPSSNPGASDSFFGINRSVDIARLSGWRVTAADYNSSTNPQPILRAIRKTCTLMSSFFRNSPGKDANMPSDIYLGAAAWESLSDEFDSKTELRRVNSKDLKDGVLGFEGLEIIVGGKRVVAWADPAKDPLTAHVLNTGTWFFNWLGSKDPVSFEEFPGGSFFRTTDDRPDIEFRMQLHPVLRCEAPGLNARIDLSATNIANRINAYQSA